MADIKRSRNSPGVAPLVGTPVPVVFEEGAVFEAGAVVEEEAAADERTPVEAGVAAAEEEGFAGEGALSLFCSTLTEGSQHL